MKKVSPLNLGRRERQIMEAVYAKGQASVSEVLAKLSDPPSYSAVRAILNTLEAKGHLRRKRSGKKFIYVPIMAREKARSSVLKNLLNTFYDGSAAQAMASLIEMSGSELTDEELDRLAAMIDDARKGGR